LLALRWHDGLIAIRVTNIVESRSNVMVIIPRITIVNSLYHHSFTSTILFLNSSKHNLVCLAALLIVCLWVGHIMPMMLLLLLLLITLQMHLLLLLLLLVITTSPIAIVTLVLLQMVVLLHVFGHKWVGFLGCRTSGFDWWWLIFIRNHKAILNGPRVWVLEWLLVVLLELIMYWFPSKSWKYSPKYFTYCRASVEDKPPKWTKKPLVWFHRFIFIWNKGRPDWHMRTLIWGLWRAFLCLSSWVLKKKQH